jgi:hypothetical protein
VAIPAGTHTLGPDDATLSVRTGRTGAAAKAGHDLLLEVTAWKATIDIGAQTTIELSADGGSLRVIEGTGGMATLGDDDKASIRETIDDEVLNGQTISFRSTQIRGNGVTLSVDGELTLAGAVHPISFELAIADDGTLSADTVVTQSLWGMKPYSTLFGTLKVVDEVQVALEGRLPN